MTKQGSVEIPSLNPRGMHEFIAATVMTKQGSAEIPSLNPRGMPEFIAATVMISTNTAVNFRNRT
jgi:hypothetical protein